ncbi:MAG TPA: hypothetical protein VMT30_07205 [Candidatus Saccharimonadia bacterium]|nr:hypothetical protein [Candidatus Saccharimonadia bacterium]
MAKTTKQARGRETDNAYFLKILIYFVLGLIWVKVNGFVVVPIGLILGIIIAQHDHFSIDRKIEYAILLVSAVLGLAGFGAYLGFWLG